MNKQLAELFNQQINKEFYSAYLYLDFANYFEKKGLSGFAHWYEIQAMEERDHAMLFYRYLHNNGEGVRLGAIDAPDFKPAEDMDVLKQGLQHEKYVTSLINEIYGAAFADKDFRSMQFLDWFVKEQGEEEKNAADLIGKMEMFGSEARALYLLDQELNARVYSAPSLVL